MVISHLQNGPTRIGLEMQLISFQRGPPCAVCTTPQNLNLIQCMQAWGEGGQEEGRPRRACAPRPGWVECASLVAGLRVRKVVCAMTDYRSPRSFFFLFFFFFGLVISFNWPQQQTRPLTRARFVYILADEGGKTFLSQIVCLPT